MFNFIIMIVFFKSWRANIAEKIHLFLWMMGFFFNFSHFQLSFSEHMSLFILKNFKKSILQAWNRKTLSC